MAYRSLAMAPLHAVGARGLDDIATHQALVISLGHGATRHHQHSTAHKKRHGGSSGTAAPPVGTAAGSLTALLSLHIHLPTQASRQTAGQICRAQAAQQLFHLAALAFLSRGLLHGAQQTGLQCLGQRGRSGAHGLEIRRCSHEKISVRWGWPRARGAGSAAHSDSGR